MPLVIPSLFKLIGQGFLNDAYAADGNHLRWMFDPRLGFPRRAFCLERRFALGSREGNAGVKFNSERFVPLIIFAGPAIPSQTLPSIQRTGLSVSRPLSSLTLTADGITLSDAPLIVDFHGGSGGGAHPEACYVKLTFTTYLGTSSGTATAQYNNRGDYEDVDRATFSSRRIPFPRDDMRPAIQKASDNIGRLLDDPILGANAPVLADADSTALYKKLVASDPTKYARVTPDYLKSILGEIKTGGIDLADLVPKLGIKTTTVLELRADHIDRIAVVGKSCSLIQVDWCTVEAFMSARGWEPVGCFPIATDDKYYVEDNKDLISVATYQGIAKDRVLNPMPRGAEPLDDPQVPPSRPPTDSEIAKRYLEPWLQRQEPWIDRVLSDSFAGTLHQSEVSVSGDLTHLGQTADDPFPSSVTGTTTTSIRPYGMLLIAACAFPTAKLMGLATVDKTEKQVAYDYRVRGTWRILDIRAWAFKLQRDIKSLQDQIAAAAPADKPGLQAQLIDSISELITFVPILTFLNSQAVSGELTLYGLKFNVASASRPLFAAPASLSATHIGLATPELDTTTNEYQGVTELDWPLRQRARVLVSETIPMGAAFGRSEAPQGQPFKLVLNPVDPDFGMPVMEVPEGPAGDPGSAGTASFVDLKTPESHTWRYGVTEVDPFGRWSPYATTDFSWTYDVPPPVPVALSAELDYDGAPPSFLLTAKFSWPTDRFPAARHSFEIHLRRSAPPSSLPADPSQWGHFERASGSGAPPLSFAGTFSGNVSHDAMPVTVSFADRTVTDSFGSHQYRDYTVTFRGPEFVRDAIDRASAWVAVRAINDRGIGSDPLAGPARADQILDIPPPPPTLPPDPLLSSYPDAEKLSSFRLEWNGAADVRYTVLRAGEREIVQLLKDRGQDTSAYDPNAAPNFRAAALKALSVHAADAFQPRSPLLPDPPRDGAGNEKDPKTWPPLPAGSRFFVDELPGRLRALSVYVVLGKSKSGVRSAWPNSPDAFAVVAVPQIPEPEMPRAHGAWMAPEDPSVVIPGPTSSRVELKIARPNDGTGAVLEYEVYRTLDPTRTGDYRLMRRIHSLAAPVFEPDGTQDSATYVDPTIQPYRTYYYRVVARAASPVGASAGTRSEASSIVQVTTLSGVAPDAPTSLASVRAATEVTITFVAETPTTPAGDFIFEVRSGTPDRPFILARNTAASSRIGPNAYALTVDPAAIAPGDSFWIRVTDPVGHVTDSPSATST